MVYFAILRPLYGVGTMLVFGTIILGHNNLAKIFLSSKPFMVLGKLTFEIALIHPIIMVTLVASTHTGLYITILTAMYHLFGHLVVEIVVGTALYLFVEYPIKMIFQWTFMPYLSHEKELNKKLMDELHQLVT